MNYQKLIQKLNARSLISTIFFMMLAVLSWVGIGAVCVAVVISRVTFGEGIFGEGFAFFDFLMGLIFVVFSVPAVVNTAVTWWGFSMRKNQLRGQQIEEAAIAFHYYKADAVVKLIFSSIYILLLVSSMEEWVKKAQAHFAEGFRLGIPFFNEVRVGKYATPTPIVFVCMLYVFYVSTRSLCDISKWRKWLTLTRMNDNQTGENE